MGFNNLNVPSEATSDEKDVLGSGFLKESGLYKVKVKMAYDSVSAAGAEAVNFIFVTEEGSEIRETIYTTNRAGEPTYKDRKTGELRTLPGFNLVGTIFKVTGADPAESVEKQVNIYSAASKMEIPTAAEVYTDLLNKEIVLGLLKVRENKNAKGDDGQYHPTNEERIFNQINKVFAADTLCTSTEKKAGIEKGEFIVKWAKKWKDFTLDKYKEIPGAAPGMPSGSVEIVTTADLF